MTLQKVTDLAVQNSRLLSVKNLQVEEKKQKVYESRVKYFPAVTIGGGYQYNSNNGNITVPRGTLGQISAGPIVFTIPSVDTKLEFGSGDTFSAGVLAYQPVSQIPQIAAGVNVAKSDLEISKMERVKATHQVKQTAEKLYYGLLILQKQQDECRIKLQLAEKKLYDVESAVRAGKTTPSNLTGLKAAVADEEQNLLKIKIQFEDYSADLRRLTGLPAESSFTLEPISVDDFGMQILPENVPEVKALQANYDLKIAGLYKTKARHAVHASWYNYLPEFGIMGGYVYLNSDRELNVTAQNSLGTIELGLNSNWNIQDAFIGVMLKWNISDLFANTYVKRQRESLQMQAEENLANTREQVQTDIAKARRKLVQSGELVSVANKVMAFRREDLKIQTDRYAAGLNLEADVLAAKAAVSKAESDVLGAQLSYRMAVTDIKILTGDF